MYDNTAKLIPALFRDLGKMKTPFFETSFQYIYCFQLYFYVDTIKQILALFK